MNIYSRPLSEEDADDWVERIAEFLWNLAADFDNLPHWSASGNEGLKDKYRELAYLVILMAPIILKPDGEH